MRAAFCSWKCVRSNDARAAKLVFRVVVGCIVETTTIVGVKAAFHTIEMLKARQIAEIELHNATRLLIAECETFFAGERRMNALTHATRAMIAALSGTKLQTKNEQKKRRLF